VRVSFLTISHMDTVLRISQAAQRGGGVPSLQTAKVRLDRAPSTDGTLVVSSRCREWEQMAFKGLFQLKPFYDSLVISLLFFSHIRLRLVKMWHKVEAVVFSFLDELSVK